MGLSREYILKGNDDPIVKGYHEYMVDVAVFLGADRDRATEQLFESLQFEIELANVSCALLDFIFRKSENEAYIFGFLYRYPFRLRNNATTLSCTIQ